MTSVALRPFQSQALDVCRAHLRAGKRSPLIVSPPGTGKTRMAVEACWNHTQQGGRPLFVAPRRELVDQARKALRTRGLDLAWVRTIQDLTASAELPPATLVVLDEARHYVSETWSLIRDRLPDALRLGLDGTPERQDGIGLGNMFDCLVEAITVKQAIADKYLVPYDIVRPDRPLGPNELAQDPVAVVGAEPTVVFARSVEIAIQYACELRRRGIKAAAVWGEMPARDRDRIFAEYEAGDITCLTNAQLVSEGWDSPRTVTVVLARGFGSAGGYLQAIARAGRPHTGKTTAKIYDLRGVSHTFGDPDEPRTWHLEGKACRRASDDPNIRFCAVCGSVINVADVACPECGREGTHRLRPPRILGLPIDRFARFRAQDEAERAATLARWLTSGKAKNLGHAKHIYRGVYGDWPSAEVIAEARRIAS